jgi:hypothetical protein
MAYALVDGNRNAHVTQDARCDAGRGAKRFTEMQASWHGVTDLEWSRPSRDGTCLKHRPGPMGLLAKSRGRAGSCGVRERIRMRCLPGCKSGAWEQASLERLSEPLEVVRSERSIEADCLGNLLLVGNGHRQGVKATAGRTGGDRATEEGQVQAAHVPSRASGIR